MTSPNNTPQKQDANLDFNVNLVDKYKVYKNTAQEIIITTEDKVRLCLAKYKNRLEKRKGWIAPLGILIAIILALVTATFKDYGLESDVWTAIFIISAVLSFAWLVWSIFSARRSVNEEDVIAELKQGSTDTWDSTSSPPGKADDASSPSIPLKELTDSFRKLQKCD